MKNILLTLTIAATISVGANAQIQLIGASVNAGNGQIDIIEWEALDSSSVTVTPSIIEGYYFGSSAFDSYSSNYYLTGISGGNTGLYSFNSATNAENLAVGSPNTNVLEFDMSTGKMYNLIMETSENISVYAYDINTNQDSLIGIINEPGAIGVVADAIGFDSNNGIIYYVGYTNDPAICLYAIPVRDSVFSFTRTLITTIAPFNNIYGVNYDNLNNRIFAINDTYDSLYNYSGRYLIEIDWQAGAIVNRGSLAEFPSYVGGSSCFDQRSSTYMMAAIDTNNILKMVAFNTLTNNYVSGFIPDMVSEIVCDNTIFARRYTVTSTPLVEGPAFDLALYPNPVADVLTIEHTASGPVNIQIFSSEGKLVLNSNANNTNKINLDVQSLSPGHYVVNLMSEGKTVSQKILVH